MDAQKKPLWVEILTDRSLTLTQRHVLQYYAWRQGSNGHSWPAQKITAQELGITERHLRRVDLELEAKGRLRMDWGAGPGRGHTKHYTVVGYKDTGELAVGAVVKPKSTPTLEGEKSGHGCPVKEDTAVRFYGEEKREKSGHGCPRKADKSSTAIKGRTLTGTHTGGCGGKPSKTCGGKNLFGQSSDKGSSGSDSFDAFWVEYPRKVARRKCERIWRALKLESEDAKRVIDGVRRYKESNQWQKDGGRFIPHPSTFLNQGRWEDEIQAKPPPKRGDLDWDPSEEELDKIMRECGMEVKA